MGGNKLSRKAPADDSDSAGWESASEDEAGSGGGMHMVMPSLLPVPSSLASPNSSLCDICKALDLTPERFIVQPGDPETGDEPDDPNITLGLVKDIREKSTCPFCRLVITALGGDSVPQVEDGEPVEVTMSWSTDGPIPDPDQPWNHTPQIRILRPYAQKQGGGFVGSMDTMNLFPEITILANDAPSTSKSFLVRPIQEEQIDFSMVRNWISICEAWHGPTCDKSSMLEIENPRNQIPSFRLIDVIDNCLTHAPDDSKYVALSYVWGRPERKVISTVKNNVAELEQPGAFTVSKWSEQIPWTIRDSMQVVRELGLRYLWVDCLCIIQDDVTGSKYDAIAKMDLVYAAAFLTIIAASGSDANSGLPGVRPGTRSQRPPVEEIAPGFRLAFKQRYQNYIRDCVYYTRGWTFQEQMFTKRSLIFIGGQVVFRCVGADQWREDVVFEDEKTISGENPRSGADDDDIGEIEGLIQTYSDLSLTYRSDIYNAFSGVANYIQRKLDTSLCHGIPTAFFDWFLLWGPLKPQTRQNEAPSWSWSGWIGTSWPRMWDWYKRSIQKVRKAQRNRTWIIYFHRIGHDSTQCVRVWTPKKHSSSRKWNFYGGHIQNRFPFDCTTTDPTPKFLVDGPKYFEDSLNTSPGSGFLQFWTVSVTFRLDSATSVADTRGPSNGLPRVGFFGRDGFEVGVVFVSQEWRDKNVPGDHEFILLCEGRDKRAENGGDEDEEDGWKYMAMLIGWHGNGQWAERVSIGSIEKDNLMQALNAGPVWKEIILG